MPKKYRSPALPQFETSSRILAMTTTWFFNPGLTLDEADKLVITEPKKKAGKRRRK